MHSSNICQPSVSCQARVVRYGNSCSKTLFVTSTKCLAWLMHKGVPLGKSYQPTPRFCHDTGMSTERRRTSSSTRTCPCIMMEFCLNPNCTLCPLLCTRKSPSWLGIMPQPRFSSLPYEMRGLSTAELKWARSLIAILWPFVVVTSKQISRTSSTCIVLPCASLSSELLSRLGTPASIRDTGKTVASEPLSKTMSWTWEPERSLLEHATVA